MKRPNAWKLHDVHGYLWEWCEDPWHENYDQAPTDGSTWIGGDEQKLRCLRGGSWKDAADRCTSSARRGEPHGAERRRRWPALRLGRRGIGPRLPDARDLRQQTLPLGTNKTKPIVSLPMERPGKRWCVRCFSLDSWADVRIECRRRWRLAQCLFSITALALLCTRPMLATCLSLMLPGRFWRGRIRGGGLSRCAAACARALARALRSGGHNCLWSTVIRSTECASRFAPSRWRCAALRDAGG